MKVKQFLNKFLYASSSIKFVYLADQVGHELLLQTNILADPMNQEYSYREELNSTVRSFQINNDAKAYFAAQKEAGTPVQVAYQLAAPEVYATDPVDIQKAAGLSISSGAVTTEIKEGQKLVVRSEADRLEIAIYTTENEWVEDVYQQSDFSTARFIYAPPGDSTLKFSHEGSQELNVSVEVRTYYEAV